jgi:hypothetical protein
LRLARLDVDHAYQRLDRVCVLYHVAFLLEDELSKLLGPRRCALSLGESLVVLGHVTRCAYHVGLHEISEVIRLGFLTALQ